MSWLFSRALVEEFSADTSLAGEPSALLNTTHMPQAYWSHDRTMERCDLSRYGMTSERLTADLGAALLMSFRAGFHASGSAAHLEDDRWLTISGRTCSGSWQMSLLEKSLPKTSRARRSTK